MKRITADSEVEEVMRELGVGPEEELRESEKRRMNLEKFAQLRARNPNVTVKLEDTNTAFVEAEDTDDGEFLNITITTKEFEQQRFDIPKEYHQYLIQKGMTIHEAAHVVYSSYPVFKKYLDKVEEEDGETHAQMFKNIFNVLEDGAIEKFVQEDYRVKEELLHLRMTLHENNYIGRKVSMGDGDEYHYPFYFAVMAALLNIGVYDNGELRKLLDENNEEHKIAVRGGDFDRDMLEDLLPDCRKYIKKIQDEREAEKRASLCYDLWCEIKKSIDRSTTPGKNELKREQKQQENPSYSPGVPQNIDENYGEQEKQSKPSGDTDHNPAQNDSLGEIRKVEQDSESENETKTKREDTAQKDIAEEAKDAGDNWSEELEEIITSLGAEGTDEVFIPDDGDVDTGRKRTAEVQGKRCAKIFRNRLRKQRKSREKRNKQRGKFDDRNLVNATRGSTRVFKQTEKGNEKNYSCMIVCDRSGSMRERMSDVELAMGSVAYGLESVGVNTCVMDTFEGKTSLAKPYGSSVNNFEEKLFAGRIGGGTPLQHTTSFANSRINKGEGDVPFMVIITDGGVSRRGLSKFKQEVKDANYPVLGVYLTENASEEQLSLYDSSVVVKKDEDVGQKLINMISTIMF